MQGIYLAGALVTGMLVPLQLAFNAQLGGVTRSPLTAALIVFLIGACALAVALAVVRPASPSLAVLRAAPPTVWLGGAIATLYIVGIVVLTPVLGVALTTVLILTGQLLMAVTLDHFGAFGAAQVPVSALRVAGLGLMLAGVAAIRFG